MDIMVFHTEEKINSYVDDENIVVENKTMSPTGLCIRGKHVTVQNCLLP